jgi:carboxymethylenebutenolidase
MSLHEETVSYGDSSQFTGFFALPARAKKPLPAVVVLQEAWGVDEHIEDVTRRFAHAGYAALAPDLFSDHGKRPEPMSRARLAEFLKVLDSSPAMMALFADPARREQALATLPAHEKARITETLGSLAAGFGNTEKYLPALLAATKFLREDNEATRGRKIGSVGYCMGGGLSGLLAANDPQLGVACIYYGVSPSAENAARIACPVLGFYGAKDDRINGTIPAFAAAMKSAGKQFEAHTYEGAGHAFSNDNRPTYDADATRDAFARVLQAFRTHLV